VCCDWTGGGVGGHVAVTPQCRVQQPHEKKMSLSQRISGIKHQKLYSYSQFSPKLRATESGFGPHYKKKHPPWARADRQGETSGNKAESVVRKMASSRKLYKTTDH
jgi:hypothetical protein